MAKKVIETITLISSDEDTPSQVDIVKETGNELIIKVEENVPTKKSTARKSTSSSINHQANLPLKLSNSNSSVSKNPQQTHSTIISTSNSKSVPKNHSQKTKNSVSSFPSTSGTTVIEKTVENVKRTSRSILPSFKNYENQSELKTISSSKPSQTARKSFSSSSKSHNEENPKLISNTNKSNHSLENATHKNKPTQIDNFIQKNTDGSKKLSISKNETSQAQKRVKEVSLEEKIAYLSKKSSNSEKVSSTNSIINQLQKKNIDCAVSKIHVDKSSNENEPIKPIQSHKNNSFFKHTKNELDNLCNDSDGSIIRPNVEFSKQNDSHILLKNIPKDLNVTIKKKSYDPYSKVSIIDNGNSSTCKENKPNGLGNSSGNQMNKIKSDSNKNNCQSLVMSSNDSKKRKLSFSEDSLLTGTSNSKLQKKADHLQKKTLKSFIARPDLPVIALSSDGVVLVKKTDVSKLQKNKQIEAVSKNLEKDNLQEFDKITTTKPDLVSETQNTTSKLKSNESHGNSITVNNSALKSNNLMEISGEITEDAVEPEITEGEIAEALMEISDETESKHSGILSINMQNTEKSSKTGDCAVLNSNQVEQQEIPMEINAVSERAGKQPKKVTSPKLSLKRKRQDEDFFKKDIPSKRVNLFAGVENETISINMTENYQPSTIKDNDEITSSSSAVTDSNLAKQFSTSEVEDISSEQSNSTFPVCIKTHNVSQQQNDMPGPSNSATSAESNKQKFELLLEVFLRKTKFSAEEKSKFRKIMYTKFNQAQESYTSSLEFSNYLDSICEKIEKFPGSNVVHLTELKNELRAYKERSSSKSNQLTSQSDLISIPSNTENIDSSSQLPINSENKITDLLTSVASVTEVTEEDLRCHNLPEISSEASNGSSDATRILSSKHRNNSKFSVSLEHAKAKLNSRIESLEKYLGKLDNKIKKLQATELSLDDLDDEDSIYIQEDKYKRKFNKVWSVLCKFKNRSARLGSEIEKRFRYEGTNYVNLNQAIEKFMNKRKAKEKFPNYVDIYNLIKSTNEVFDLGLSESDYSVLAKKVFQDIGHELKKRRKRDVERDFGCFLTDEVKLEEDPAEKDPELKSKLESSIAEGEKKLNELIEKYASKQETEVDVEGVEEDEESDVSLEPEYHEPNDDLPDTDPATPETADFISRNENIASPKTDTITVIDIASDSNASTDPGPEYGAAKPEKPTNLVRSEFNISTIISKSYKEVESDSSEDLPPL